MPKSFLIKKGSLKDPLSSTDASKKQPLKYTSGNILLILFFTGLLAVVFLETNLI